MSDLPSIMPFEPAAVARAVARLPFLEREALLLSSRDHLTYGQIGAILGLTPEAAEARCASALVHLRRDLEKGRQRRWWSW